MSCRSSRRSAAAFIALFLPVTGGSVELSAQAFGTSAMVVGDDVAFGEPVSFLRPGTVYVYRSVDGGAPAADTLRAADGTIGDRFGASVAASGNRLIVGAPGADGGRGAAYVFERQDGSWRQTAKLVSDARDTAAGLGATVALDGDLALIAYSDGKLLTFETMLGGTGSSAGSREPGEVVAFRLDTAGEWTLAGRLRLEGGAPDIGFGSTLALRGDTAFVGAPMSDGRRGRVHVFVSKGDEWLRTASIEGPGPGSGFGAALTFGASDRLLIGAPLHGQAYGAVHVLEQDASSGAWLTTDTLRGPRVSTLPGQPAPGMLFGASLAAHGDEVWIGAVGTAFSVRSGGAVWSEPVELTLDHVPQFELAGVEVALGEAGAVGIPLDDFGVGSGVILSRRNGTWQRAGTVRGPVDTLTAVTGGEVRCRDGRAGSFDCDQVDLVAFLPTSALGAGRGVQVTDLWGWTDPENGREYVIVGRGDGTAFVDIGDPANPVYLGELPRTEGTRSSPMSDIKVYRDHAFIVADAAGAHGMQVFDLQRLRGVGDAPVTFEPDAVYDRLHSAHNLVINPASGFAYAVSLSGGGDTCGGGLHMIDIREPLAPRFAGCATHEQTGSHRAGITHDSQCILYDGPDADYREREICFSSNPFLGLVIADVTDRADPETIAVAGYPGSAIPHQGWLTEDRRYFLMGDEGDEFQGQVERTRTLIWDVADLDDPVLHSEYFHATRAIDHNLYVRGSLVYQANFGAGLRIIDIGDIDRPREVGFFDTVPHDDDVPAFDLGAWTAYPYFDSGIIAVSSGSEGLFLLRYTRVRPVSE
jgi:choice-of-anchor B domain-containing protein